MDRKPTKGFMLKTETKMSNGVVKIKPRGMHIRSDVIKLHNQSHALASCNKVIIK